MSEQSNVTSGNAEKSRPLNFVQSCCRTSEAAAYLGLSPRTLERHRCCATGPAYHKLGGRVVYPSASVRGPPVAGCTSSACHSHIRMAPPFLALLPTVHIMSLRRRPSN